MAPEYDLRRQPSTTPAIEPPAIEPPATSTAGRMTGMRGVSYADGAAMLRPSGSPAVQRKKGVGEHAAQAVKDMDETQSAQIDARGYGDYTGIKSGETKRDGKRLVKTDCTTFVIDALRTAFAAAGMSADWTAVFQDAQKNSKGGFKGTELMKSLQAKLGWVGVYWSPDSKSGSGENDYSTRKARKGGGYYGIGIDKDKVVTDYAPGNDARKTSKALDKLRRVNFGVLCAKGGTHMATIVKGQVYEVHWSDTADSHDMIEFTPIEDWGWGSGAIVMPPDEIANWNGTAAAQ